MESICPICKKPYDGVVCTQCTVTDLDVSGLMASEGLHVETQEKEDDGATAFLVDLVSNRKIPITTPRCKVGRDDLNDIVISGDQSISRFHFVITKENNQYLVQDGKSRHGTFLNGNQITVPEPIHDGDVLKVGVSLFWFVIENVVLGAESDKTSPVDMEADEAELEFGAPEPAAAPIAATVKPHSTARSVLSETGAFPALDMSAQGELLTGIGQSAKSAPKDSVSGDLSPNAKSTAQEFSPDSSPESTTKSADSAEDPNVDHSYRTPHDDAKVINSAAAEANSHDFGNLSFFEPLTEVVNELGADSLTLGEPISESGESPEKSDFDKIVPDANSESDSDTHTHPAEHEEAVSVTNEVDLNAGTLGSSTLESAETSVFQPTHNNFESLFEAEPPSDLVSQPEFESSVTANDSGIETAPDAVSEPHAEFAPEPIAAQAQAETNSAADVESETSTETASEAPTAEVQSSELYSASTLEKLAEAVEEAGSPTAPIQQKDDPVLAQLISEAYATSQSGSDDYGNGGHEESSLTTDKPTSNGAKSLMSTTKESLSATVPDWCNRYFHGELTRLSKELTDLNEQVRYAQQKIKEVEGRVSLTKGLRNTLLTATGEELVEGCGRVLSLLGWRVKISEDDKNELRVETDEKHTCIARVVWTETQADRTHLGQLSISQTRYWCEQGIEPKGILIVSRSGESGPPALTSTDLNSELADYASKKNVCLMTTLQLLAIFKDIALHDGSMDTARATIMASNGWLPGFNLEPSDGFEKEEGSSNKLSSLLSA